MSNKIYKVFSGMVILVLISKGLGFVRESFIAARYGAGFVSDVYVLEDGLINAIYTIWAGIISTTFIPTALGFKKEDRERFTSNYLNIFLVIIISICIFSILFTDQLLHFLVPGFYSLYSETIINQLVLITRINMISLILVFLENFFIVLLQSKKIYLFSSFQGIILNTSLIIYLIFLYQYGIWGIIITKFIAHSLNIIVLLSYIKFKKLYKYERYLNFSERYIKEILRLAFPVLILNVISQLNFIVDRSMASMLDTGSMALLNYSNVIANLLYSVLGVSLTSLAYTELSVNQKDSKELYNSFLKYARLLFDILIPASIVMIVMRYNIASILFGRGKIDLNSINTIIKILILYIPSSFFLSLRDLLNRLLYIHKKTIVPSVINGSAFILNIILNIILIKIMGVYGLALATSITSLMATVITYIYSTKNNYIMKKINIPFKKVIAFIVSATACYLVNVLVTGSNIIAQCLSLIFGACITFVIYDFDRITVMIRKKG